MFSVTPSEVREYVLDQARRMSAHQNVNIEDRIYQDLEIGGGDAIEFFVSIERKFQVDLKPITETCIEVPSTWWRKAHPKLTPLDPSLSQIVSFLIENAASQPDE